MSRTSAFPILGLLCVMFPRLLLCCVYCFPRCSMCCVLRFGLAKLLTTRLARENVFHQAIHHSSKERVCHRWLGSDTRALDLELADLEPVDSEVGPSSKSKVCHFLASPAVCKLSSVEASASPGSLASSSSKACQRVRRCDGARDDELEVAADSSNSKVAHVLSRSPAAFRPRTLDFGPPDLAEELGHRTLDFGPPDLAAASWHRALDSGPPDTLALFIHFWMTSVPIRGG